MKTRVVLICLFAALVVVAVLIQPSRPAHDNAPTNVATETVNRAGDSQGASASTSPAQPKLQRKGVPGRQNQLTDETPPATTGSNPQQQLEELARQRGVPLTTLTQQLVAEFSNGFSQELNRPIEFYGKVVDESGLPLKEATATINCLIFPEKQITTNISTDVNGLFAVQGISGQALLAAVRKENYEEAPGTNEHHFVYYGVPKSFQPDRNSPVVFILRKKSAEPK